MKPSRFGTAASMLALATVLAGCATGGSKRESIFGSKVDRSNIGLATRAQAALSSGDVKTAIDLAERAVENTPNDAGFRGLLGNCYFAAGRFASAETAYRDSLSLLGTQPQVVLKLALVQIAQGKAASASGLLEEARNLLDPSDYGLAVALAGRPDDAVAVLNQAARLTAADARVRQNLALAYGLAGDWTMARTIASQDVPAAQLEARLQQWMIMATPTRSSDQVAALTGVTPAAADPGQPVRLALNPAPAEQRVAQASIPQVQPQPAYQPASVAEVPAEAPVAMPEPMPAEEVAQVPPMRVEAPEPEVVAAVQSLIEPAPVAPAEIPAVEVLPAIADAVAVEAPILPAVAEAGAVEAPIVPAVAKPVDKLPTSFDAPVQTASYVTISDTVRRAAERSRKPKGNSKSVVQLGAYSSPERVTVAWNRITMKYPALRDYTPMRARFNGPKGTVWRLSIKGFASQQEAVDRCEKLQGRGGSCFVRSVAGDAPVQIASR